VPVIRLILLEDIVEPLGKKGPETVNRAIILDLLANVSNEMMIGHDMLIAVGLQEQPVSA
jgi:hypothetical protein